MAAKKVAKQNMHSPAKEESATQETNASLLEQIALYENKWKRALADYQNLEKRIEQHQTQMVKLANATLLKRIVEVLDDFHRAASHIDDQGLHMVLKQLHSILDQEGLNEIETDGRTFEAELMECVELVDGPKDKVVKTLQKGYRLYEAVLRPARVTVGKG